MGPALPPNSSGKISALPTASCSTFQPVPRLCSMTPFRAVSLMNGFTMLKSISKSLGAKSFYFSRAVSYLY